MAPLSRSIVCYVCWFWSRTDKTKQTRFISPFVSDLWLLQAFLFFVLTIMIFQQFIIIIQQLNGSTFVINGSMWIETFSFSFLEALVLLTTNRVELHLEKNLKEKETQFVRTYVYIIYKWNPRVQSNVFKNKNNSFQKTSIPLENNETYTPARTRHQNDKLSWVPTGTVLKSSSDHLTEMLYKEYEYSFLSFF